MREWAGFACRAIHPRAEPRGFPRNEMKETDQIRKVLREQGPLTMSELVEKVGDLMLPLYTAVALLLLRGEVVREGETVTLVTPSKSSRNGHKPRRRWMKT